MSQQDVEQTAAQQKAQKSSTEQLHIKDEPETRYEDTQHKSMRSQSGSEEYLKFKNLNEEVMIKEEPVDHEYYLELEPIKAEPHEDELRDSQEKSDAPSENVSHNRSNLDSLEAEKIEKHLKCDVCEKPFSKLAYLKTHIRTHTGEKPYQCNICNKSFSIPGSLNRHMLIHSEDRPYKCDFCEKTFNQYGNLKTHIRTHNGDKPYKCNSCEKTFNQYTSLKRHIATHTVEKPSKCIISIDSESYPGEVETHLLINNKKHHRCNICEKTFSKCSNLKNHIRTHTGEKPYTCAVCNKSMSRSSALKAHMLTHSEEKPHTCNICNKTFRLSYNLKRHICRHKV